MTLASSSEGTGFNPMSFTDQHGSIVLERLRYQRETGRFCDVLIIVKDRNFSAHRNILSACSPYFDSIFKTMKVTKEQVTVNCPSPGAFELLLNYMYSGQVVIDRSTVSELLRLANNFLVTKLKNYCAEYLDRYLDAANCLTVRLLAAKYNLPLLLKAASDYFDVNINRCLLESVDVLNYSVQQLLEILNDPKYCDVITPDTHLKLIVRWVGEDLGPRERYFRLLLSSCPVNEVHEETLDFLLDYSPLFAKSPINRFALLCVMNDFDLLMEKYQSQFATLRQKIGELPPMEPLNFDDEAMSSDMEDEEDEDAPVEGHPTTSQLIESTEPGERPRLKLKISFAQPQDVKKRFKKSRKEKKKGRSAVNTAENETIPLFDDDDIDGVYATSSLEGAVTYGIEDLLDPDEVENGEDVADENGPFVCAYCKFATGTEENLEKHRARLHNRNTYFLCPFCEFESNWSKEFYGHCREHMPNLPYCCDLCSYSCTSSIQELLTHRLTHNEERLFKCGECAWKGRTRTQVWAHERMHSVLDDRALHCEECGRGFTQHSALDLHVATHSDHRPIVCDECGFATKVPDHLVCHRRQHTGDIFLCHIDGCDYSSPKKSQLAAHLRTHMAVRAHMCKVCGRGFIEKSHLVRHERIHLEDKPFKCDACEYASSRRDKLKEHILKHHNGPSAAKSQRRRYRRARQLAAIQAPISRGIPPEALFRPIPANESVSQWAEANNFNEAYSPSRPNDFGQSTHGAGFSPQRAYSAIAPPAQQTAMSPGSMSLLNVHLHAPEPMHEKMLTVSPTTRSPHNRSADPFGISTPSDMHRPMSLPTYGQMQEPRNDQPNNSGQQWWQ